MAEVRKLLALALLVCFSLVVGTVGKEQVTHRQTFLSPAFELGSGDVVDNYKTLEFPEGHIAMRSFEAEVVDEEGKSVPLTETYLHHWVVMKFYVRKGFKQLTSSAPKLDTDSKPRVHHGHAERMAFQEGADVKEVKSQTQGSCRDSQDSHFFGVGAETRRTNTSVPAPYGFVSGDSTAAPEGYEEAWYLNVHAIDTRGAVDPTSCLECLCEAYGVTKDSSGRPLSEGYIGGLYCCFDKTHCAVKADSVAAKRTLFLKYVVTWVDWDETVVPVRSYVFDLTDPRTSLSEEPHCKIEYDVPLCNKGTASNSCVDHRHSIGAVPIGGDLIYGVMHQHAAGLGGIAYDKDGLLLCSSFPIYGKGTEAGDEAGYVVGMTTCFPEPGSIKIENMKELRFDAFYNSEEAHTGVMSLFTFIVADPITYIAEVTH